jgi:hypothetical protein
MSQGKWGESFLKSGLPLEHLTQVVFRTLRWDCYPQIEYSRLNRDGQDAWFELDLMAIAPPMNRDTDLAFLVECKYHDASRYWFFLPQVRRDRWYFNDRVLNCAPYQTLQKPRIGTTLDLAPASSSGIVISEDGTKQDNAVHTAVQQLVNGYVPVSLSRMFGYNLDFKNVLRPEHELAFVPWATALVPVIVTNARLYRLKENITKLEKIRQAGKPADIAHEVDWTWCYHDPPRYLYDQNLTTIRAHAKKEAEFVYRFPGVEDRMYDFVNRPNWIAVVHVNALAKVARTLLKHFQSLETRPINDFLKSPKKARKRGA